MNRRVLKNERKKKHNNISKMGIRGLLSAAGVLCVLAICIAVAGYQEPLHAEGDQVVTRGVIDSLGQLPQYKKDNYDNNVNIRSELGKSKDNPLLILEIVPDEAFAEFGYLISGCEPIAVEEMFGQGIEGLPGDIGADIVSTTPTIATFFEEEPQAQLSAYRDEYALEKNTEYGTEFKGYYERVQEGKGTFAQDEDGNIIKIGSGKGSIIWHTICEPEMPEYEKCFKNEKNNATTILEKIGDRIYTTRVNTQEDQAYNTRSGRYCYYKNHDVLLTNSLNCSEETAKDYNIVIKTITPKELNDNPKWADYADLFVVSPTSHNNSYIQWYDKFSRKLENRNTGKAHNVKGFVNTSGDSNRDVSWSVVRNMYDRIADTEGNFAAVILDDGVYGHEYLNGSEKSGGEISLYDWNLNKTDRTYNVGYKSNNNLYKLSVMLFSMKPSLFQSLYLNPEGEKGELIDSNGQFLLRDGEDADYWSMFTFLLVGDDYNDNDYGYNIESYWNDQWERETYGNITVDRVKVNGHVFTYNGDMSITQTFKQENIDINGEKFDDFKEWLEENPKEGETVKNKVDPSEAVRYILQTGGKGGEKKKGSLNILDIEPCYDSKNGYSLKESYIRMMIPDYTGTIQIKHMTTAEFIGSAEDLNSTYDMIFMGLDSGAYNLTKQWTGSETAVLPDWNDNSMDGKIYFHTGDKMSQGTVDVSGRSRWVSFLWSSAQKTDIKDSKVLRFPGNDITKLKQAELENYLQTGNPIVAVPYLYRGDQTRIDQYSNICNFVKKNKGKSSLYETTDTVHITEAVEKNRPVVEFEEVPAQYDGTTGTTDDTKTKVVNPNYLERDSANRSLLRFRFSVKDSSGKQYSYRIYLDQNQDGKFDNEELYRSGSAFEADGSTQTATCKLSRLYMGLIQWKIEVYQVGNEAVRYVRTGCSAAKNIAGAGSRKQIKVLQIVPKGGNYDGALYLESNPTFTQYYHSLDDYTIDIDTITVDEYLSKFTAANTFVFDYSKDVSYEGSVLNPSRISAEQEKMFNDYNMFIIGFGDTYGGMNISNTYGAVDFIKYFIAYGKSVLFTHDLTSMHNVNSWDFGYSANKLLRDTMGMNRYEAVSQTADQFTDANRNTLLNYQKQFSYDTVTDVNGNELEEKHGFTYYAMKRLGWDSHDGRMPYQYLITNTEGESICGVGNAKNTGLNNNNDLTKKVTQSNQGQITEYPYKIDESFEIAKTHGQWYQLNMEDPEVTVWYCLSDNEGGKPAAWQGSDSNGDGTGATYGVSPNDAANNYYIYSKGNVFYSGVGHSTVNGDMEAKLFINTMIAAYRATYEPPMVEVLNPEAELTDINSMLYKMNFAQEYNNDEDETADSAESRIEFSPVELNAISTKLDSAIYYEVNGTRHYVTEIYEKDTGKKIVPTSTDADDAPVFENLQNMGEYYFMYPEKYLNEWKDESGVSQSSRRNITFKIKNDKAKMPGYTKLDMTVQALFQLD